MQELTVTAGDIGEILLLEEHTVRASEPAGGMWFPPEFFEYFTLEQ